jgi:hypothetical protein
MPLWKHTIRKDPSQINFAGHSYLNTTIGIYDQPYRVDSVVRAMLGIPQNATINRALSGAQLCAENPGNAGWTTVLQQVHRPARGAPYIGRGGPAVLCWGINDIGKLIPSSDFGVGTTYTQIRNAFKNALRAVISRYRASHVAEAGSTDQSAQWGFQSGWLDQALTTINSGAGYRRYPGAASFPNNVATYTIPSDIVTTNIAFGFIGQAGLFGGTLTIGGTAGFTGTISTSNIMPVGGGNHGHVCRRFAVTPSMAGQTITFSVTATDTTSSSSEIDIDYAQIESNTPPLVVVCNIPRLRDASAYTSYAGSYWANGGNNGASGDTDVANFNADIASVVAEFTDGMVVIADIDSAMGKSAANYGTDGIHPNETGALLLGQAIVNAIRNAPTSDANVFQDYRATMGRTYARAANCWYTPDIGDPVSTTYTAADGDMFAFPWFVTEANDRIDGMSLEVTTAGVGGAPAVRMGMYDDEDRLGYPQCVLDDWGSISATTTGIKTVITPTVNRPLDPGNYWIVVKVDVTGSTTPLQLRAFTGYTFGIPYSNTAAAPPSLSAAMPTAYKLTGQTAGSMLTQQQYFARNASIINTAAPFFCVRKSSFSV